MKRLLRLLLGALLLFCLLLPMEARADTGPKPSVSVTVEGMGEEVWYGTLLSPDESTGPFWAWDGTEEGKDPVHLTEEVWRAFAEYEDADGFCFLQIGWDCSETGGFSWTYYPPDPFKILLYCPETGAFQVSGVYQRYAFDSYFTLTLPEGAADPALEAPVLTARKSYDFTWELISLAARVVMTILAECALALLFGFREKRQLKTILTVNILTQLILNVLLNVINYNQGGFAFFLYYLLFELAVFLIEAVIFSILLPRVSQKRAPVWKCILYALLANILSYYTGYVVALSVPGLF